MHSLGQKQYGVSENEITSITYVASWHGTAYPIFLAIRIVWLHQNCLLEVSHPDSPNAPGNCLQDYDLLWTKARQVHVSLIGIDKNQVSVPGIFSDIAYFTRSTSWFTCFSPCSSNVWFPNTTFLHQAECKKQRISCTLSTACTALKT